MRQHRWAIAFTFLTIAISHSVSAQFGCAVTTTDPNWGLATVFRLSSPQIVSGTVSLTNIAINVRDCGAKGDGVTNDFTAIQNAVTQVAQNASGGGVVFIPNGTYRIGATIIVPKASTGVRIIFESKAATLKILDAVNLSLIRLDGCTDCSVENGTLDGALSTQVSVGNGFGVIFSAGTTRGTVNQMRIVNTTASCVFIQTGAGNSVTNSTCDNNGSTLTTQTNFAFNVSLAGTTDCHILNNLLTNGFNGSIGATTSSGTRNTRLVFAHNFFSVQDRALSNPIVGVGATDGYVAEANTVFGTSNNAQNGFDTNGSNDVRIIGNRVHGLVNAAGEAFFAGDNNSSRVLMANNTIDTCTSGFSIDALNTQTLSLVKITGNVLEGVTGTLLNISKTGSGVVSQVEFSGNIADRVPTTFVTNTAGADLLQYDNQLTTGAKQGTATLSAGTVTIATTEVRAGDIILVTRTGLNSSPAVGNLTVGTITAGTSFVVNSESAVGALVNTDVSQFFWKIVH